MAVPNTWEGVSAYAESVGAKFGQLVAAQWALESGYGKHVSAKHNYFGLKSVKGGFQSITKEFINGQWMTIRDGFIDFPSLAACIDYLVRLWYKDFGAYKGINNAPSPEDGARMLQKEGYATDPSYADKLIKLLKTNSSTMTNNQSKRPIRLANAAKFYAEESHQIAAWNYLEDRLTPEELNEFALLYRSGPKKPSAPKNPLQVPYFSQRDNLSGTGYRECFSSSCAMLAAFHGKINSDDAYNNIRSKFGDSTDSNAQIKALRSLGLNARFSTIVTEKMVVDEINAGRPVAVGWLHYGPYKAPSGGGHWSVIIGYTDNAFIHNDPYGEADMMNGGYFNGNKGAAIAYSKRLWLPRWRVGGSGGWAIFASK